MQSYNILPKFEKASDLVSFCEAIHNNLELYSDNELKILDLELKDYLLDHFSNLGDNIILFS